MKGCVIMPRKTTKLKFPSAPHGEIKPGMSLDEMKEAYARELEKYGKYFAMKEGFSFTMTTSSDPNCELSKNSLGVYDHANKRIVVRGIESAKTEYKLKQQFVEALWTINHERRHKKQYDSIDNGTASEAMVYSYITTFGNNEIYYKKNYSKNILEIDAEESSTKETVEYLEKEHSVDIDEESTVLYIQQAMADNAMHYDTIESRANALLAENKKSLYSVFPPLKRRAIEEPHEFATSEDAREMAKEKWKQENCKIKTWQNDEFTRFLYKNEEIKGHPGHTYKEVFEDPKNSGVFCDKMVSAYNLDKYEGLRESLSKYDYVQNLTLKSVTDEYFAAQKCHENKREIPDLQQSSDDYDKSLV